MKTNKILSAGEAITKFLEVCHWINAAVTIGSLVVILGVPLFSSIELPAEFEGSSPAVIVLSGFSEAVAMVLTALIFRNLHQILKNAETGTPFRQDNIAMLRKIGIYSLLSPTVALVIYALCRTLLGDNTLEISVGLSDFSGGIIVLCLTQFFIHGAQLEEDVEGLL